MKVRRTAILFVLSLIVLSQIIVPRHESHKALYADESMIFTPTICDLHIPDGIGTETSRLWTAIEGTSVSVRVPDGYCGTADFGRFQRDKDTSFIIREYHDMGFAACRKTCDQQLAQLTKYASQDVILLYRKNFSFNNYDATAVYLYDKRAGLTHLYMAFGDERFHVTMRGSCRADDLNERDRILHTFLTAGIRG